MKILDRLPIMTADTPIYIGNEMVRLRESQIIVWMSVSSMTQPALPGNAVQFPVILDTGHSHHFAILASFRVLPSELLDRQIGAKW